MPLTGDEQTERRAYSSEIRRRGADQTRAHIARVARDLFRQRGWARTRVQDVAAAAGVSPATVYTTYGSKTGLARALLDAIEASAAVPVGPADLAAIDPAGQLAALVDADRDLYLDGGDVIALLRDAGPSDVALHAAYLAGRAHGDELRHQTFTAWPAGALRTGVDVERAVDVYAALVNIDVFRELRDRRGWQPETIAAWWRETLTGALLA